MDKPDWNATVGKVAGEYGPAAADLIGRTLLKWSAELHGHPEGTAGRWFSRFYWAAGNGMMDEATYQRLVLDELERDEFPAGVWAATEEDIERMIAEDVARLEREAKDMDGRGE